jgi:hypothetical protein
MPTGGAGGASAAGGLGGTAGTGGAGTGGAGDSGSSGAGTGGTSLPDDWAKCLTDLLARCPLVGTCVESDAQGVTHTCYPDGARTESEEVPSPLCGQDRVERVYGSDGSLCYTSLETPGLACEHRSTSYSDGDGNAVAELSGFNSFGPAYVFTCSGGVSIQFDLPPSAPPPLPLPSRPICEPGVCPLGEGGMGGAP